MVPLRLGTLAGPKYPAGRRTIFYRDKSGQHRPLRLSKDKIGAGIEKPLAFLVPPRYYRNMLDSHLQINGRANDPVNKLPQQIKTEIFREFKIVFYRLFFQGVREIVWDPSGIYSLRLSQEKDTGTFFMSATNDRFIELPVPKIILPAPEVAENNSSSVAADQRVEAASL
ncbi:MAG: hypothetical protein JW782_02465 [Candidatus Saganbacteria bacterium]|nr:hypothetical protein [Candidatus Saganbacteria bacterium]